MVLCFCENKGIVFLWMKRITHFLDFLDLSTTEDDFSESLKQESSGLVTGDTASLFLGTTGKGAYVTNPLVLSFLGMLVHLSGT